MAASVVMLGAGATGAAAAAALPGGFVPYRSIGGVRLGEYEKTVRARLGAPNSVNLGGLGSHSPSQLTYGRQRPFQSLLITFDQHRRGDPVARIQAAGNAYRTSKGIGYGSSQSAVHHAVPDLKREDHSLIGNRGSSSMEIDFSRGRVGLITLTDDRLRAFTTRDTLDDPSLG